jgi:hypothetical protein
VEQREAFETRYEMMNTNASIGNEQQVQEDINAVNAPNDAYTVKTNCNVAPIVVVTSKTSLSKTLDTIASKSECSARSQAMGSVPKLTRSMRSHSKPTRRSTRKNRRSTRLALHPGNQRQLNEDNLYRAEHPLRRIYE